jgi:hypothetical protein
LSHEALLSPLPQVVMSVDVMPVPFAVTVFLQPIFWRATQLATSVYAEGKSSGKQPLNLLQSESAKLAQASSGDAWGSELHAIKPKPTANAAPINLVFIARSPPADGSAILPEAPTSSRLPAP